VAVRRGWLAVRDRAPGWTLALLVAWIPSAATAGPSRAVELEAGIFLTSRSLSFQGEPPGPTRLRGYSAGAIAGPWLHVAGFPLSGTGDDLLAGLGVVADLASSVGLQTSVEGAQGSEERPSWLWQAALGLEWRVRLSSASPLTLVPALSWAWQSFTTSPVVPGLPDARLSGIRATLGVEWELDSRLVLLADAGWAWWLGRADMVGEAYFPSGRAQAFQAALGLEIRLADALSLRALGFWSGTWYALEPAPYSPFQATGARDDCLGGRLALRATY
jgi:hypothetical protein